MDIEIDLDKLASMKYAQLRTLAKTVGIKANMKVNLTRLESDQPPALK